MKRLLFATLLCLIFAPVDVVQGDEPIKVILEGYVGDPPTGVKPGYTWTVGQTDKVYKLQVVKHESLSATMSTMDIDNAVEMYKPNFQLAGDDKSIATFTSAKPGERLKIIANLRLAGTNQMELESAQPVPAPK
jgi:hypothetical protein